MCAKRLERFQRDAVAQDVAKRKGSYEQIAKRHSISQATVSRIPDEYGVGVKSRNNRTAATEVPEETYDSSNRKAALDRLMKSVDDQVSRGGQSSKQLLDLARAAKEISTARANEDKLVDPDLIEEKRRDRDGRGASALSLVDLNAMGTPKDLEIYFSVLDVQGARDNGDHEEATEAEKRVKDACAAHGFREGEIDIEAMLSKIDKDFHAQLAREEARKEARKQKKAEGEFNGQGLA
jgi:hypothetical protein